jgi:hypothetical protein
MILPIGGIERRKIPIGIHGFGWLVGWLRGTNPLPIRDIALLGNTDGNFGGEATQEHQNWVSRKWKPSVDLLTPVGYLSSTL